MVISRVSLTKDKSAIVWKSGSRIMKMRCLKSILKRKSRIFAKNSISLPLTLPLKSMILPSGINKIYYFTVCFLHFLLFFTMSDFEDENIENIEDFVDIVLFN